MEINGYSKGKQNRLYKTALSRYEASYERVSDTRPKGHEEKPAQLYSESKTIRGEIIDLRLHEAKIRMEPDGQIISARIDGNVSLYIGQTADFVITDNTEEQITLRLVSSGSSPMNDIAFKALSASGLAASERNMAIVQELLNHQMPVDKDTIMQLIKLSATYPDTDIKTLILLYKNQLPVNPANIAQLELYQQGMHRILDELNTLTENIGILLEDMTSQAYITYNADNDTNANSANKAFAYDEHNAVNANNADNSGNTDNASNVDGAYNAFFADWENTAAAGFSDDVSNTSAAYRAQLINLYNELLSILGDGKTDGITFTPDTPIRSVLSENELTMLYNATGNISGNYEGIGKSPDMAGNNCNTGNIDGSVTLREIIDLLSDLYDKGKINPSSGESIIPGRLFDTLIGISGSLFGTDKKQLIHLLSVSNYHKHIARALHNRWTLSPDNLKEEIIDKKFFRRLYEDLERLKKTADSKLFGTAKSDTAKIEAEKIEASKLFDASNIRSSINKLQDNLQFMRDLNELFLYLQLPLRLAGRDAHGDLYVFTRKHKAYNDKEQLNVLLHLDMANLGPVDIHMTMKNRQVNAVFYLEKSSEKIVSGHLQELAKTLQDKGYQFQAKTKVSESKPDFITDILQKDASHKTISRYSFDIRA